MDILALLGFLVLKHGVSFHLLVSCSVSPKFTVFSVDILLHTAYLFINIYPETFYKFETLVTVLNINVKWDCFLHFFFIVSI